MQRTCGCCMADPFGAPRENCFRCNGTGVIQAQELTDPPAILSPEEQVRARLLALEIRKQFQREVHAKDAERARGELEQKQQQAEAARLERKKKEYQKRMQKIEREFFDPSPNPGSPGYFEVRRRFAGKLYRCLTCGYDANLYLNRTCGQCGSGSKFDGPL